jgi:Fe-S oxidoreductase
MSENLKPEVVGKVDYKPPEKGWMEPSSELKAGCYNYSANPESLEYLGLQNNGKWMPLEDDWLLPENWKQIILDGMKERLDKYRSFKVFLDICVRCGVCADKCHFYIGSGDPKNMPVLRTELIRSVYRKEFTKAGKILGKMAGGREMTIGVLKEWFSYFYQCTECRRCSVFCPYGIDTAEITMMGRELLNLVGLGIDWICTPAANCFRTGNHLGIQPHGFQDSVDFAVDDLKDLTGVKTEASVNRKGAEILFVVPSADYFGDPHYFGFLGYLSLFHEIGLDYTFSSFASEGGNFGLFHSSDMIKRLNSKIYSEAKRLGVKWIIGGECGHMWRVLHQYMDTMNGPADFLEAPVSPITGTKFENAKSTKMVHIAEFTADLIHNNKIKLDKSRNDQWKVTFHDSCNTARAMGLLDEPREVLNAVCNNFHDMPENCIREQTFCCGSGSGIGTDENMEVRMRGGLPRANAVKYVHEKHGVNLLTCVCAIDKATLPGLMDFWVPGVQVGAVHELVGNALVMKDEKDRVNDLRGEPFVNQPAPDEPAEAAGEVVSVTDGTDKEGTEDV